MSETKNLKGESKKEKIIELLNDPSFTDEQIAQKANTSTKYVAKLKSQRRNLGTEGKSGGKTSQTQVNGRVIIGQTSGKQKSRLNAAESAGPREWKIIYREARLGKSASEIVAKYGIPYELVQNAVSNVIEEKKCDPYRLQKSIIDSFASSIIDSEPEAQELLKKVRENELVANSELVALMRLVRTKEIEHAKEEGIEYATKQYSEISVPCAGCGEPMTWRQNDENDRADILYFMQDGNIRNNIHEGCEDKLLDKLEHTDSFRNACGFVQEFIGGEEIEYEEFRKALQHMYPEFEPVAKELLADEGYEVVDGLITPRQTDENSD